MGPRGFALPSASTQSAKDARSAFYCALCAKGYTRQNDFEAHQSSYDHLHKKRLKEMKEMQRSVQPKKSEDKASGIVQIKLGGAKGPSGGGGGFKKGGFKSAFGPADEDVEAKKEKEEVVGEHEAKMKTPDEVDSDITDNEDYYDPRKPAGCMPGCGSKRKETAG